MVHSVAAPKSVLYPLCVRSEVLKNNSHLYDVEQIRTLFWLSFLELLEPSLPKPRNPRHFATIEGRRDSRSSM